MRHIKNNPRNGFFTTCSLQHPFDQCVDNIGRHRVAIWANQEGLPLEVMADLQSKFQQSNSGEIRPLLETAVAEAEKRAVPLACRILGKA